MLSAAFRADLSRWALAGSIFGLRAVSRLSSLLVRGHARDVPLEAARRFNAPGHSVGLEPSMLQNYQWRSDPLGIFAPWNLGGR